MKKIGFLFLCFTLFHSIGFGQDSANGIIYIVDSIPVIEDPKYDDNISQSNISDVTVIVNKDSLTRAGYGQYDKAIFIFTKEYRNRPDSLKRIPSIKQMQWINGAWNLHGNVYSGRFIDYYYTGYRQGEGTLVNGKAEGIRKLYYQNGQVFSDRYFQNGLENGMRTEFYSDGNLKQEGAYTNGKENGIWKGYYPNGQIALLSVYKDGEIVDSVIKYFSNGKIAERVFIKNGKAVFPNATLKKIKALMEKSQKSNKDGDAKSAIAYCSKIIALDSAYVDAYFSRGTMELNDMQFDAAILDFDKALQIEPYMYVAHANRAFARIRKYQFANSRTLSKNDEVTILASKDKVSIPSDEKEKICSDLHEAVFLGDESKMIYEALADYCEPDNAAH